MGLRVAWSRHLVVYVALWVAVACGFGQPAQVLPDDPQFQDFTSPGVGSVAELVQLAALDSPDAGLALAGAKFVITDFSEPQRRRIRFLDGCYYRFHDEWAWFRLLNGQSVSGMPPLAPHPFAKPEDARRWARAHELELPDGLELIEGRLYAREFYELSLARDAREIGAGALIHVPAHGKRPEVWGFEIDYTDAAGVSELGVFWSELRRSIPEQARAQLKWIARSPEQLAVGRRWVQSDPALAGHVMTYAELSIPGETQVYTPGIVAGRLRAFRELSRLAEAEPEDILLLGALPEYLPQASGLVTAIPQTPLAHLNLLAKSRQIVNAYRGGVLDDPDVRDLLRSRAPVVVAAEDGRVRFVRITEAQYRAWRDLQSSQPLELTQADASHAPYVLDLAQAQPQELPRLAGLIGGKAAGMLRLLHDLPGAAAGARELRFDVPDRPLCISVRAYREHLAPLLPQIEALLADENFLKFKQLRFLALEGSRRFLEKFRGKRERALAKSYLNPRALGPIAAVVRKGGLVSMIRHAPLPAAVKAEVKRALSARFGHYAPQQGLRFRSSSTVEDIEGFNGAGLYVSSTGYLEPRQGSQAQRKRASVSDALRKTWASYFGAEAFEERHQNHIDHLAADMAVLVHPRFDDELEQANGVFTFTLAPGGNVLAVNAQRGAVSVTNPPTDRLVIPESARVMRGSEGFVVQRLSLSSLMAAGRHVLSDAELQDVYRLAERLAERQLADANRSLPPAQQRRSLVLDFEFRRVAPGWPALREGSLPARFIVKQMRPLEPSPHVSAALRSAPIPRDVLARARRIESRHCQGGSLEVTTLSVLTEPSALPDLGYARQPLLAGLSLRMPGLAPRVFTHLELEAVELGADGYQVELSRGLPLRRVAVAGARAELTRADGSRLESSVRCETRLEFAEPRELLRSFLAAP